MRADLSRAALKAGAIVFLHHRTAERPVASGAAVTPARFVRLPSIAYRLARVAAGDGVATVSLSAPGGIDYAAGHALLRGAGGVLLDEAGQEVTYSPDGESHVMRCFGGAPEAARELAARSWRSARREEPSRAMVALSWPRTVDDGILDRAKGCLFGQVIGDNLGALVEFQTEEEIADAYPDGVRDLRGRRVLGHSCRASDGRQRARPRPRTHPPRDRQLRPGGDRRGLRRLVRIRSLRHRQDDQAGALGSGRSGSRSQGRRRLIAGQCGQRGQRLANAGLAHRHLGART